MATKNRKQKHEEYINKYKDIPIIFEDRLSWMIDKYNIKSSKMDDIINKRNMMLMSLEYKDISITLFEEPEGSKRPRFRYVNKSNFINQAITNPGFVHVYVPDAHCDNLHMKRLIDSDELNSLNNIIYTPCTLIYDAYIKTPTSFNITDTFLSEIGLIRPICKPDWDNIGKKYSDMSNANLWLDDSFVMSGTVNKYYSILPRIEIKLKFLNMAYNKYQYNSIIKRSDYIDDYNLDYLKV